MTDPAPNPIPELSILTVNYRCASALLEAQRRLAAMPPACSFEWIVVNHSPEEGIAPCRAIARHVRVIDEPNLGFARGVNAAARVAAAPVLFLANPDLVFDGALLDGALERLAAEPDVGVLGPQLLHVDCRVQRSARRFYTWPDALFARLPGRDALRPPSFWRRHLMLDEPLDEAADVDWLLGAALFVRRSALRDVRGDVFDPRYFLYFEDVDLCMELWSRGWRVRYDPSLGATHAHARASRSLGSKAARVHAASFFKFVRKWGGLPRRPAAPPHAGGAGAAAALGRPRAR